MKATRKLIPAIAMLLISAVMMSTASFAWFSTNTTALADNVSVKIAAANTLLIKKSTANASSYATYLDLGKTMTNMDPVSTAISTTPAFWMVDASGAISPDSPNYATGTTNATTFKTASEDEYYHETINVRATGEGDENGILGSLKLSFTTNPNTVTGVSKSLRLMFIVTDVANSSSKAVFVYSPFGDQTWTCIKNYADNTVETETSQTCSAQAGTTILSQVKKEADYIVDIYAWYEGQDSNCYANNATNIAPIAISIQLDLEPLPADGD